MAIVRGVPFYGYHAKEELFIKVYLYDPKNIKIVGQILQSGIIGNRIYQLFEAHIPYLLQVNNNMQIS